MSHTAIAAYRRGSSTVVSTPEDVDALVDDLLASDYGHSIAKLHISDRPLNDFGFPDHELMVAVDAEDHVGGLRYVGPRFGGFSKGQVSKYDEVVYYYLEHDHEFPRDSVVPVDDIRQAVKEFLASGGECPTCVQWQQDKL